MIDSVGNVGSVLLVGGTSQIGQAILTRLTGPRLARVVLAGRTSSALERAAALVAESGVANVEVRPFDAADRAAHRPMVDEVFTAGDIDVAIMAVGVTAGLTGDAAADDDVADVLRAIDTNLAGVASCATQIAQRMRAQGHGALVMLVAAPLRQPNAGDLGFSASQAGLDSYSLGLADWMRESGARVILVRLGHIETKLGTQLARAGRRHSAQPADVANAVAAAVRSKRASTVFVPASVRAAGLRTRLRRRTPG